MRPFTCSAVLLAGVLASGALSLATAGVATGALDPEARSLLESKVASWLLGSAGAARLEGSGASDERLLLAFLPAKAGAGLDIDPALFDAAGGEVVRRTADVVLARVPLAAVPALALDPSIGFVRPPLRPVLEKVAATRAIGAQLWHDTSLRAEGVKVGIIDLEYAGYQQTFSRIGLTRYRTWSPAGVAFGDARMGPHGTACTEVLHAIAPDAELYLAQVGGDTFEADFSAAFDWVESQGVSIVSVSIGVTGWLHDDGASSLARRIDLARERGILCSVAAGNDGDHLYWGGEFSDSDGDGFHEYAPGDEGNAILLGYYGFALVLLTWDGGERTAEDLDLSLHLLGSEISSAVSATRQVGEQPSLEALLIVSQELDYLLWQQGMTIFDLIGYMPECAVSVVFPDQWDVRVRNIHTTRNPDIRVYAEVYRFEDFGGYLIPARIPAEYSSPARSIGAPADAAGAIAVGAIGLESWDAGEIAWYSSQGPTSGGRLKPEISAPTALATQAYSPDPFEGTSASAPVCAGAAALVRGLCPEATADLMASFLFWHARDVGAPGADTVFGAGELRLPSPATLRSFLRGRVTADPSIDISDGISILRFLFMDSELPPCLEAADVDDSGTLEITDGIAVLNFLFLDGAAPAVPFEECCPDLTPDKLGCGTPPECE